MNGDDNVENVYQEHGYEDRFDYLRALSDQYNVDYDMVIELSNMLGESEDFDSLISAVGEAESYYAYAYV